MTIVLLLVGLAGAVFFSATTTAPGQWQSSKLGETAVFPMKNAPYPHDSRRDGFKINDRVFPRHPHYIDDSVAIFIPKGYRRGKTVDLLLYFHGHYNNIWKAFDQFGLREQVAAADKNVILVFPEGPKDAGDSGCGKLEEPDGLKRLVAEVLETLAAEHKIDRSAALGRVLLAGHSGAYKGISFCVRHGGLEANVTDVGLLDATYANLDFFADWVARRREARLFSIFTDHLAADNVHLMTQLRKRRIVYELFDEADATDEVVHSTRILFLHTTKKTHDQTVQWLQRWLHATSLPAR